MSSSEPSECALRLPGYQQGQIIAIVLYGHSRITSPSIIIFHTPFLWTFPVDRYHHHTAKSVRHNVLPSELGKDSSYHTIFFGCLTHGLKGGDIKYNLNVQESSQKEKPIFERPVNLINKIVKGSLH
jgi:hypothetical protein